MFIQLLLLWVLLAMAIGYYAKNKGNAFFSTFILSLFLTPIIGFFIAWEEKPKNKCRFCKGFLEPEATVCRYCGREQ